MGIRFRKTVKLAPGVKLNLGKKSASISVGEKGAKYTVNTSGRQTATVGIPGTGLSYSKTMNAKNKSEKSNVPESVSEKKAYPKWLFILLLILGIPLLLFSIIMILASPVIGIVFSAFAVFIIVYSIKNLKHNKDKL